ncbi:hypothetical protein BDA99DRAFT_504878 [Phascolomyces articulosus]|uniref:F-box domain-containing protein n=1 Tax=Phascolomyces articulosus TaxID=60185 RepID=A0AAD5PFW0_9FUNG|nr:hypothetical protein BDA99DRAFT_504878 [Phascolomyces articulosus]
MIWSIIEYWLRMIDMITLLVANAAGFFQAVYEIGMNDNQQQLRPRQQRPQTSHPRRHRYELPQHQQQQQQEEDYSFFQQQQQEEEENPYHYTTNRRHENAYSSSSPQQQRTQQLENEKIMRRRRYLTLYYTEQQLKQQQQQQQFLLKKQHHHHQYKEQQPNYINQLPNEILTVVFEMTASPHHLYQCTLVNHRWHALVTPILWRAPVLTGPVCCFPLFMKSSMTPPCDYMYCQQSSPTTVGSSSSSENNNAFPIHLEKYGTAIRKLVLPPQHTTDCSMAHIARSCPNLQDLTIDGCKRVSHLGLLFLTRHVQKLERLSMNRCILIDNQGISYLNTQQKLTTISMAGLKRVTSSGLTHLVQELPQLHTLDISDCSGLNPTKEHHPKYLKQLFQACGTKMTFLQLNRLTLFSQNNHNSMSTMVDWMIDACPNLQHVGMARKLKRSSDQHVTDLIDSLEQHHIGLTRLGANLVRRHRQRQRQQQQKQMDPQELDQHHFLHVLNGLKQLQSLDVSNWNALEESWVKKAVTGQKKMIKVQLSGSCYVTPTPTTTTQPSMIPSH